MALVLAFELRKTGYMYNLQTFHHRCQPNIIYCTVRVVCIHVSTRQVLSVMMLKPTGDIDRGKEPLFR